MSLCAGFSFDVAVPANSKSGSAQKESSTHSESPDTMSNADAKSENYPAKGNHNAVETDLMYMHSDEESKSPQGSPRERTAFDSPSGEYSDNHFGKSFKTESETDRYNLAIMCNIFNLLFCVLKHIFHLYISISMNSKL